MSQIILLNYCNSTDYSIIIDENYNFNLTSHIKLDNNIFFYELILIKTLFISHNTSINIISKNTGENIINNKTILPNDTILLKKSSINSGNYYIEFQGIIKEPNLGKYDSIFDEVVNYG